MKKHSITTSRRKHKMQLFMSLEFCIISLLAVGTIVFLALYIIGIRISVTWESYVCNNLNVMLVSIATGYIVSYLFYILTIHIQNYKQSLINERVMSCYLSKYKNRLLYCFGGIIYFLKMGSKKEITGIPEITKLFESRNYKDKIIANIIKVSNDKDGICIIKDFERLENEFQYITELNALHKSRFSDDIYFLQINNWSEIIYIIKDEILHKYQNFQILEDANTISLINKNFDMVNKAVEVEKLIN